MDQPDPVKPLSYFYHYNIPLTERGVNRCKIGDTFQLRGVVWRVVEVIPFGMYPSIRPNLRVRGYYREHESYVIERENGQQRWPQVGTLLKAKK
jgi:hypothetical protein